MKRFPWLVVVLFLTSFCIGFIINILGPLVPDLIDSFGLSLTLASFLPFSLFVSFGIISMPAGILIEKYTEKPVMLFAFALAFASALFFALLPSFAVALLSLLLIGMSVAILQVAINPLLRQAGGEAHFAFNSVVANFVLGVASFISPLLYQYLVKNIHSTEASPLILLFNKVVSPHLKWLSLYWIVAVIALLMGLALALVKFPKVASQQNEKDTVTFKHLLHNKVMVLFFIGVCCYVGTEQGLASWMSKFLQTYHSIDPTTRGASVIAYFWALLTIGCLVGLVLLKLLDSRLILLIFTTGAIISLVFALYGSTPIALIAFPACGFFISVLWPIINSLALNSVGDHHGSFSGILYSGIGVGATIILLIGHIGERVGLQLGMSFLFLTLGYIFTIAFWAKPLVNNATIKHWRMRWKISQH